MNKGAADSRNPRCVSALHQGVEDGLLGVEPVLGLVEDDALRSVDDLGGDLLSPVRGEAVHYDAGGLRDAEQIGIDLVVVEQLDRVLDGGRIAHRHPGVGVKDVRILAGLLGLVGCDDLGTGLLCNLGCPPHDLGVGHADRGAACNHVDPHDGAGVEQGVAHVVPVSEVDELLSAESSELLLDSDHIGQSLAGVLEVVEAADDGNRGVLAELIHHLVIERTVHDAVDEPAHDTGGVLDGLAVDAHLHLGFVDVERVSAEFGDRDIERDPGAGAGLLEDHRERLAFEGVAVMSAFCFQFDCEVDKGGPLVLHIGNGDQISLRHGPCMEAKVDNSDRIGGCFS